MNSKVFYLYAIPIANIIYRDELSLVEFATYLAKDIYSYQELHFSSNQLLKWEEVENSFEFPFLAIKVNPLIINLIY
jgi:hypothetical protein